MFRSISPVLFLALICCFSTTANAAATRPNLLLITVDDMSADSVGIFGSPIPDITPNIDRLAREGIRFVDAHVQVANCMPSRNVMWSGRYPQSNKVEGFYQVRDVGYPTLADVAKKAGYFTAIRHKLRDSTPYYPYDWDMVLDDASPGLKLNAKDPKSYGLSTAQGIKSAKSARKPFYLLINIADPHLPFVGLNLAGEEVKDVFQPSRLYEAREISVPGFLIDDPIVRQELAHYYSSVRRADDAVGAILQALKDSGESKNTLVMFISDHGMPFPFAKTQLYHQSTRTPLIFRWPNLIKPGAIDSENIVSAVDLLPTLAEVMGAEIPSGVDGRSFLPLLKGEFQDDRGEVFKAYNENASGERNPMRAVEGRRFLYIFNPWSNGSRTMFSATNETKTHKRMQELAKTDPQIASRLDLLDHRVLEEFYNIEKDPNCLVNLIADPAYQHDVDHFRDSLEDWLRKMQDPMLGAFLGRNDPKILATYMQEQQTATTNRLEWIRAIREQMQRSAASKGDKQHH